MKKRVWPLLLTMIIGIVFSFCAAGTVHAGTGLAVTLDQESITMYVGSTQQLSLYVGGSKVSAAGWTSSKKSVAAVNKNGVVTAKKAGTATITCKTGYNFNLTCKVTVKARTELKSYLTKNYTKLAKKAPTAIHLSASNDPAGIGNVYVFNSPTGQALFFRYNIKTKKPVVLQLSSVDGDTSQNAFSLYGVYLGATAKKAKTIMKASGCKYVTKYTISGGYEMHYKKSGHKILLKIRSGKVEGIQWYQ